MKLNILNKLALVFIFPFVLLSCEEFVEVEAPNNKLVQEFVFSNDATAKSAMTGIYNQLFLAAFANGNTSSVTLLSGLSADNITSISTSNIMRMQFEQHDLQPDNTHNLDIWSSAYNTIYMTNAMLEGLNNSNGLSSNLKTQLEGEARFIRAFAYFYLVNLYGDIPLILTTDYRENQLASRDSLNVVYAQITDDLETAISLLGTEYSTNDRTQVNKYAATALLARVYLYIGDWMQAEILSSQVISETSRYELLNDLNEVFLANSKEAIWQISPIGGGGPMTHTNEGSIYIIDPFFSFFATIHLEDKFIETFEETDLRFINWTGYNQGRNAYFVYKYKVENSMTFPIKEYSMTLRLAEQYLIRAEARTKMGDLAGGIEDLDVIRQRAGLEPIAEINSDINQQELLDKILEERRMELFAEGGHRWFDLKRIGRAGEILGADNPNWESTDLLYPIPAEERMKNPNLSQNPGY